MKAFKLAAFVILVFIVLPFSMLALLWKDRCKETQLEQHVSPAGEYALDVTQIDCGDYLKVATEVTLAKRSGDKSGEKTTVLLYQGKGAPKVSWDGERQLHLEPPAEALIVKTRREWQNVAISIPQQTKTKPDAAPSEPPPQ